MDIFQIFIFIFSSLLVGISKTSGLSLSPIIISMMTEVFQVKRSVGILAVAFGASSIYVVFHYLKFVQWKCYFKPIPGLMVGIILGAILLNKLHSDQVSVTLGVILLVMLALNSFKQKFERIFIEVSSSYIYATIMGFLIGFSSLMANAADGLLTIYLLTQGLSKQKFIATFAIFFILVDFIKIPIYIFYNNIISTSTLLINLYMVPFMILGVILGIYLLKYISTSIFNKAVVFFTILGAIQLIIIY